MFVSNRGLLPIFYGRHPTPHIWLFSGLHGDLLCGWHKILMDLPMSLSGSLWRAECLTESSPLLEESQLGPGPGHHPCGFRGPLRPGFSCCGPSSCLCPVWSHSLRWTFKGLSPSSRP